MIYIYLKHFNECIEIKCGAKNDVKRPCSTVKASITLSPPYLPATLAQLIVARYYQVPHHTIMMFNENGAHINNLQGEDRFGKKPLNIQYDMLRLHCGGTGGPRRITDQNFDFAEPIKRGDGEESEDTTQTTGMWSTDDNDDDIFSFDMDDIISGGVKSSSKRKCNNICIDHGNVMLNNALLKPDIHAHHFQSGEIVIALPFEPDHIARLTKCNDDHNSYDIYDFQSIISEFGKSNDRIAPIIPGLIDSTSKFVDNYLNYICKPYNCEGITTNRFTKSEIIFKYPGDLAGPMSIAGLNQLLEQLDMIDGFVIWVGNSDTEMPTFHERGVKMPINDHVRKKIMIKLMEKGFDKAGTGFVIIVGGVINMTLIFITKYQIYILMLVNNIWTSGPYVNNDELITDAARRYIDNLYEASRHTIKTEANKPIHARFKIMHEHAKVGRITYTVHNSIPIALNADRMTDIGDAVIKHLRDIGIGMTFKSNPQHGAELGWNMSIPCFYITKRRIKYMFNRGGDKLAASSLDMNLTDNIMTALPDKMVYLYIFHNFIMIHAQWMGVVNLNTTRRILCSIYAFLIDLHFREKWVINISTSLPEIEQLTNIDPQRFMPPMSRAQYSSKCQRSRQPIYYTKHDVDIMTKEERDARMIIPVTNLTNNATMFISCGPQYNVISYIPDVHPQGRAMMCCILRVHLDKSTQHIIREIYMRQESISTDKLMHIRNQKYKSIQSSHLISPTKTIEPIKTYATLNTSFSTYFSNDWTYAMFGLFSPFTAVKSYAVEAIMRHTDLQITNIIDKFVKYVVDAPSPIINMIIFELGLKNKAGIDDIVLAFRMYQRAYDNSDAIYISNEMVLRMNKLMHILTYRVFGIIMLLINKTEILNFTSEMMSAIVDIAENNAKTDVVIINDVNEDSCYPIYLSWKTQSKVETSLTQCIDWKKLISEIKKSNVYSAVQTINTKISRIGYNIAGVYSVSSSHIYGLYVKRANSSGGYFPIKLMYNSTLYPLIDTPPSSNELLTYEQLIDVYSTLSLPPILSFLQSTKTGKYLGFKSDRIYYFRPTNKISPKYNDLRVIKGNELIASAGVTKVCKSPAVVVYYKRVQLDYHCHLALQKYISKFSDDKIRKQVIHEYYSNQLSGAIQMYVKERRDVVAIMLLADGLEFEKDFNSRKFMFDYYKGQASLLKLSDKERESRLIDIFGSNMSVVKKYSVVQTRDVEISIDDAHYYARVFSFFISFKVFIEKLFNVIKPSITDIGVLSDQITVFEQSNKIL